MKSRILNFKNCFINACFLFSIVQVNAQGVNLNGQRIWGVWVSAMAMVLLLMLRAMYIP
jgi:hypothetical protein